MEFIRQATLADVSRIAEILVFNKRINFRPIFQDDAYSFGELQVLPVAQAYLDKPETLAHIWVYDDGIVKGLIHVDGREVKQLYVDAFFASQGIGGHLLEFAIRQFDVQYLWALEKNTRALEFYADHGFRYSGQWQYEEGTTEHLWKLVR